MPSSFAVGQFVKEERPAGSDTKFDKRMYASLFFNPESMNDVVKNEKWYGRPYVIYQDAKGVTKTVYADKVIRY